MEKDDEMMDYEELIGIPTRTLKHPPVKVETARDFL